MELTRRRFLKSLAAGATATLCYRRLAAQSDDFATNTLLGVTLEPFVDPLVIPPIVRLNDAVSRFSLTMSEFQQKLHRDLPPTVVWGFQGIMPGPTIVAERGRAVTIEWLNRLPSHHRLSIDHSLDGSGTDVPDVRTTIHLHGGHVAADNDGYPEDWITPGQGQRFVYPNQQPGATLWYHDHAMGITRLNSMMGLAGFYLLHDPEEDRLGLPSGRYDIPLLLQDRILDTSGQLVYPVGADPEAPWVPEFLGTNILVNGRVSPYLDVEPRLYRFRFLNGCNARVFQLSLRPEQNFIQIGADGGLLPEPAVRPELLLAPSERADALIDFRGREGRRMMLVNHASAPYPSGGGPVPGLVMEFRVGHPIRSDSGKSIIPDTLAPMPRLKESDAVKTRRLRLVEVMSGSGTPPHRVLLDGRRFHDPITEDPKNGSIEIWEFVNTTVDAHPIHLHAVHFQLLDRRAFDRRREQRTGEIVFSRTPMPPAMEEQGWKDTVLCPPAQVTRIIIPFSGEPGRFAWHCHTLEHEDNEMMRPYLLRG